MLPLLQQSQQQLSRAMCFIPYLHFQPRRPLHIQAPSFAARPLYMSKRRRARVSFIAPRNVKPSDHVISSAETAPDRKRNTATPANPLYSYAALQHKSSAVQAPAAATQKQSTAGLQTYAKMAVPTIKQQPSSQKSSLHGSLRGFALLSPHSGIGKPQQSSVKTAGTGRSALKRYAQLHTRS